MLAKGYLHSDFGVADGCSLAGAIVAASVCSRLGCGTTNRINTAREEITMAWEQFEHGWRRAPISLPAKGLVVLMHRVGSNARDLMPLADIWSESLPDVAFTSLDG